MVSRFAIAFALAGPLAAAAQAPDPVAPTAAVVAEFARLAGRDLWPGFDPRRTPIAIYDGTRTLLFNHPSPPAEFTAVPGHAGVAQSEGRFAAVTANSSATIGGVTTATLMPGAPGVALTDRAGIAIHEAFHVYQRTHHTTWQGNEAELFTYPMGDANQLAARRREYALLRRALATRDRDGAACDAFVAVVERRTRFAALGDAGATYERRSELNEGLATYVEKRATAASDRDAVPDAVVTPDGVRAHVYVSGVAWARLLDRFAPRWRDSLERGDARALDEILGAALGRTNTERPNCGLPPAVRDSIQRSAEHDVAALTGALAAERERFLEQPGWRLVIDASRSVVFPNGFDPLNVKRVTEGEVLHTRYVTLGNADGAIEVLGRGALSAAAGKHPLFNGVRLVTVAGLEAEPTVTGSSGAVTVLARGVRAEFKGATVNRDGQVVRVVLRGK